MFLRKIRIIYKGENKVKNPQINEQGTKRWYNKNGQRHRDGDKPAIVWADGDKFWYRNGKPHRDGGKPAVERAGGDKFWYQNEKHVDSYQTNFGCFEPKNREEALERLNSKERPYSRELYLADIDRLFPLTEKTK